LLSDAVLAAAIGCNPKWLYNAAARLRRPIRRTAADAKWWRLVYTLAAGLGARAQDAAAAASLFLGLAPDAGRVRLPLNGSEAVSLSVDLLRFHDCADVALAAALAFTMPRPRGRPRRRVRNHVTGAQGASDGSAAAWTVHAKALNVLDVVASACDVIVLRVPHLYSPHHSPRTLRLLVDISRRRGTALADALNTLGARPRGVESRPTFRFDPSFFRVIQRIALSVGDVAVDLAVWWPGVGTHNEAKARATVVRIADRSFHVADVGPDD